MGYLGSLLGTQNGSSGGAGLNYSANATGLVQPVTADQANLAYNQSQSAIAQQQAFLNQLQAQNGIGNQSSVFNQMGNTAGQLQGIASGTGPNPAMAQLNQATGANVANQAALMAGQRGAGANPALIARQAAQQGAATQQQAAGQGATMQAQQSLGALGQLSGVQANMGNLATQQVGQQAGALTGLNTANQNEQGALLGALNQQNTQNVNMQSNINSANAGVSQVAAGQQGTEAYGLLNGGGMGSMMGGGGGGGMAEGGVVNDSSSIPNSTQSSFLQAKYNGYNGSEPSTANTAPPAPAPAPSKSSGGSGGGASSMLPLLMALAKGGKVPAMLSPGEVYLSPKKAKAAAKGKVDPIKAGEKIPGKAKVKGDSYANDIVPKTLEEGGLVLPKSVMEDKNPHWAAHRFVSAHMGMQAKKKNKKV